MNNLLNKTCGIFILIILATISFCERSFALEVETHRTINKHIANRDRVFNSFSFHQYLQNNLEMQNGTETYIKKDQLNQQIFDWLTDGGEFEDKPSSCVPYWRSRNHFHNPIENSGFSAWWDMLGLIEGISVIDWINKPSNAQGCGYYSWNDARKYYYAALTATNKATREINFAETFRALGQSMHLIQDMSVPEHTRNNGHYIAYDYEKWVDDSNNRRPLTEYSANYFKEDSSFPLNIQNLFDTQQYNGTNPDITFNSNIGLSEYTSANFLSPDTIFNKIKILYPAYAQTEYNKTIAGNLYLTKRGHGDGNGSGERIETLARAESFYNYLPTDYKKLALTVKDPIVYEEYANKLIPRAIGYSSQVLHYFFRGQMKVENMPVFDDQNNTLKELYVKVRNTTPTKETMVGNNDSSCFSLSWHYTPAAGGSDIYGRYPYCLYLYKPLHYGLDADGNDFNDDTYTTTIIFNKLDQIPNIPAISKTDYPSVEFTLTYLGTLGDEKMPPSNVPGQVTIAGAVIGKVFKPAESILFDEEWMTAPQGDNLVWSISSDSSGNALDTAFINNFFYCPDTQYYASYGCPSGCPSTYTDPQGISTDTIVTANSGNLLMTNTANVIPGCDPLAGSRPSQGNIVMIGSDMGYFNCQGQYVTSGNTYNPVDSANNFIFPIKINENSYIQFSLDEMSISPAPPASDYALAYQILEFKFNHGYVLQFSTGNQSIYNSNSYVGYFGFDLGYLIVGNIYDFFAEWGFPTPPRDFQLMSIKVAQQALWNLPCNAAYTQKISVDNIRIGELKSKQ